MRKNIKNILNLQLLPSKFQLEFLGYVNNPGLINLESTQSSSLNSAIAAAGGYLERYLLRS